jgi:hypothetical protein
MLTPSRGLQQGLPTLVGVDIDAADTTNVRPFSVGGTPGHNPTVRCQAVGTFTAFTGNLEESHDGQTNWSTFIAFDFAASEIFIFDAAPGVSYRFNPSTVTAAVDPSIYATLT